MDAEALKRLAHEAGFELAGIARIEDGFALPGFASLVDWVEQGRNAGMDYMRRHLALRESPESLLPGCRSALMVGKYYAQPLVVEPGSPKIARYAQGRDYHTVLRKHLKKIAQQFGLEAHEFRVCVDSAPLAERELAMNAGLGWFGKNTMLINSARGSYYLIAALLTTRELHPDSPAIGGCGTCRACIDACPTNAIVPHGDRWQVDSRRCLSYWTIEHRGPIPEEIAKRASGWTFGCDICQEVCPFNQARDSQPLRAQPTTDPDFLPRPIPSMSEIEDMDEHQWDAWSSGRAIRRATLAGMKRNAQLS